MERMMRNDNASLIWYLNHDQWYGRKCEELIYTYFWRLNEIRRINNGR